MAFCNKCGKEIEAGSQFCKACGAPASASVQQPTVPLTQVPQQTSVQPQRSKYRVAVWLIPLLLILLFSCCCFSSFIVLSLAGAKGQPSTIVSPSPASESKSGNSSGTSVPIPTNLNADSTNEQINLEWDAVSSSDLENYKIYKSLKPGEDFTEIAKVSSEKTILNDSNVKKGVTYYYVVSAITGDGAESGNSNQVSAIVEAPPLIPKGIYSWGDVQKKCKADSKYRNLLEQVTGLTMVDVNRLVQKEKNGMNLKTTLQKGTIITNTTKNYKLLPNYKLKTNRIALTDENGVPHVLVKCGNPMKILIPITTTSVIIQQTQIFITNVIFVMPPPVINIFINAAQTVNNITVVVLPNNIKVIAGITFAPPPPDVLIDSADFSPDSLYGADELEIKPADTHEEGEETPTEEETTTPEEKLPEGHQWIEKGKLLVIANPPDPSPGQSVTMIVRLTPAKAGVEVSYEVSGTDGYHSSGTKTTDQNGEISFIIPGGATGVKDTIKVNIPSEGLEGSAEYIF